MTRLATILVVLLLLCCRCAIASGPSYATARQHFAATKGYGPICYVTLDPVPEAEVGAWHRALMFSVASASRATVLENHLPHRLDGTRAYWLDLESLKWSVKSWNELVKNYPYAKSPGYYVRADWLIHQLADTRDSKALYLLLYDKAEPFKTDRDFMEFWGVDEKAQQTGVTIGWTETNSQVNKQGTRFVERYITASPDTSKGFSFGRSLWRTKDSFFVQEGTDPLETLDGSFLHQGRELIVQFPKLGKRDGKMVYGAAQAYLLAAGNADAENKPLKQEGLVVQEAPVRLVEDFHKTLGQAAIVNNASCITCHDAGMKFPTENGLENLLRVGVELHVYDRNKKEQLEAFNLTDVGIQLQRDCEDYAEFVRACNGLNTLENAQNYKRVLDLYLAPLTLEDAARELYCAPDDLRLALGYASANHIDVGNRLAGMAHGKSVPRTQWESDYLKAQAMVEVWKNGTPALMAKVIANSKRGGPVLAAGSTDRATKPVEARPADARIEAQLVITCPADCSLTVDGKRALTKDTVVKSNGASIRTFTMQVKPDWRRTMVVRATWVVNGVTWLDTHEVECKAGERVEVVMDFKNAEVVS